MVTDGTNAASGLTFERISIGLLNHAKADPDLDSVRNDPRFQRLLGEMHLAGVPA